MGELTTYQAAIALCAVALGLRGAWVLPRLWRNELGWNPDRPPAFWVFDLTAWRGLVRASILATPLFLGIAPGYVLDNAGTQGGFATGLIVVSVLVAVSLGCVAVAVFLFNRPKWAVVPHLRHQSGAIAEWRGKRSAPTPAPSQTPGLPLR